MEKYSKASGSPFAVTGRNDRSRRLTYAITALATPDVLRRERKNMTTEQPPAGWYPDPSGKPGQMYWNGQGWNAGMPAPTPLAVPAAQPSTPNGGAAYGVDAHGRPLSDKNKMVAGLLQLFLGSFGIGRFYLGYDTIAGYQIAFTLGSAGTLGWIWGLIDAIRIFTGNVPDAQGRTLRD